MPSDSAMPTPSAATPPAPRTDATPRHARSPERALRALRWVVWLATAVPLLAFALIAVYLYQREFSEARQRLDADARVAQEQALKMLETSEMVLQRMQDMLRDLSDAQVLARGAELHERLRLMSAELPQVQSLVVIGADARGLLFSRVHPMPREVSYADREYFAFHRDAVASVFVTEQLVSRVNGEPFFDLSRRRSFSDGRFAGTLHVSLRPEYLTRFYGELAGAQPGMRMALMRNDGRLLARWPDTDVAGQRLPPQTALMQAIAAGHGSGALDSDSTPPGGDRRLTSYRRLGTYPLYASASLDHGAVVADWLRLCGLMALFAVPATIGLTALASWAQRRTREELGMAQRLQEETEKRQRVERAMLQSQKLEALGRLTGGVAHDFNNLLMVIGSNVFLQRRLRPDLADSRQLATIERATDAGAKLTRQMLAFARKQPLQPQSIDPAQRLPELLDLLRPVLGSAIELECEVAPGTAPVRVDLADLELAFINLAINARDAMQGRGRLSIRARNAAADELPPGLTAGEFVVIDVSDTGPGIADELAERVFEPFYTTKGIGQGTGLGLSQVQAMCVSAGGMASAGRHEGGGARLRLFLARSTQAPAVASAAVPSALSLRAQVLLVEDNAEVADATQQLLETLGCTVERAADGAQARALVQARQARLTPFDLVLSDIEMPGDEDGIALAEALRAGTPPLPVVLMTGYATRLDQAVGQRFPVLPKPCSPAMLAAAMARVLQERAPVA
jgi:signal transduction histidine kinase/ActR/RegA family two-component response regulator